MQVPSTPESSPYYPTVHFLPKPAKLDREMVCIDPGDDLWMKNKTTSEYFPAHEPYKDPSLDILKVYCLNSTSLDNFTILMELAADLPAPSLKYRYEITLQYKYNDVIWKDGRVIMKVAASGSQWQYTVEIQEKSGTTLECAGYYNSSAKRVEWSFEKSSIHSTSKEFRFLADVSYDDSVNGYELHENLTNAQTFYLDIYSDSGQGKSSNDESGDSGGTESGGENRTRGGNDPREIGKLVFFIISIAGALFFTVVGIMHLWNYRLKRKHPWLYGGGEKVKKGGTRKFQPFGTNGSKNRGHQAENLKKETDLVLSVQGTAQGQERLQEIEEGSEISIEDILKIKEAALNKRKKLKKLEKK
ncbi:MAG: hypothetical protein ACTSU5_04220 [Promethearchaeota archaeon]